MCLFVEPTLVKTLILLGLRYGAQSARNCLLDVRPLCIGFIHGCLQCMGVEGPLKVTTKCRRVGSTICLKMLLDLLCHDIASQKICSWTVVWMTYLRLSLHRSICSIKKCNHCLQKRQLLALVQPHLKSQACVNEKKMGGWSLAAVIVGTQVGICRCISQVHCLVIGALAENQVVRCIIKCTALG